MPIKPHAQTKPISYEDFHSLDYEVTGIVFSIHRNLAQVHHIFKEAYLCLQDLRRLFHFEIIYGSLQILSMFFVVLHGM